MSYYQGGGYQPRPYGYYSHEHAPSRNQVPKVVGILAIIFSSLGLFWSMRDMWGVLALLDKDGGSIWTAGAALSLAIFGVHLTAGIMAVGYRKSAPLMFVVYAVLAFAAVAWNGISWYRMFGDFSGVLGGNNIFIVGIVGWPITALVLMTRPSTRAACNG